MAPAPFVGRYKLYKAGTTKLVDWLASTASQFVKVKSIVEDGGVKQGPAKHAKQSRSPTVIRTQELIHLAEAILASDPPADVPIAIIDIASEVIAGRSECADWYSAQALEGGGDVEQQNESHRYFILLLQKVLDLLRKARARCTKPVTDKQEPRKQPQRPVRDQLVNLFACLELEEPSAQSLGTARGFAPSTSKAASRPTYRLAKSDDDEAFELWCFIQDLHDVRMSVKQAWADYVRGDLSFFAASSITDVAFGLLRCTDQNFQTSTSRSTESNAVSEYLGIDSFNRGAAVWMCPYTQGGLPRTLNSTINVVELLCPVANCVLTGYGYDAKALYQVFNRRGCIPLWDIAHEIPADERPDTSEWHPFAAALYKLAPTLHDICHARHCHHKVIDEFVHGLAELHRVRSRPMWLVVACQIYLDIYDLLGDQVEQGSVVLQTLFKKLSCLKDGIKVHHQQGLPPMDDVSDAVDQLHCFTDAMTRVDECYHSKVDDSDGDSRNIPSTKDPASVVSLLESKLPAHAGGVLADMKIGIHHAACDIANHGCFVLSVAHIYRAFRASGLLKREWQDMEFVIAGFGVKQSLVASVGARLDHDAAGRHYKLAIGTPATAFASGGKHAKTAMKKPRKIIVTSPYISCMRNCGDDRKQVWQQHGIGYSKHKTVEAVLAGLVDDRGGSKASKKGDSGSRLRTAFTPAQLLSHFRKSIVSDEPQLNFDYVGFMLSCVGLMQTLLDQIVPYFDDEEMNITRNHFKLTEALIVQAKSHPAVVEAAGILQAYMDGNAKTFVKEAYAQSSGRIPKALRPQIKPRSTVTDLETHAMHVILNYANIKYALTGDIVAAYHPVIRLEKCSDDCCNGGDEHDGAETDVDAKHHHEKQIVAYGSALPKAILEEAKANFQRDPSKLVEAREKIIRATVDSNGDEVSVEEATEGVEKLMQTLGWS